MYMSKVLSSVPIEDLMDNLYPAKDVMAADHLIKLKKDNQNDVWAVIDGVIGMWAKKRPDKYNSVIIQIKQEKETRANEFGANKKAGLRYKVSCPQFVHDVLRRLYDPDELPMDKEFWKHFWKRYPVFRVSERS